MDHRRSAEAGPSRARRDPKSAVRKRQHAEANEQLQAGFARKQASNPRDTDKGQADNQQRITMRKTTQSSTPSPQPQSQPQSQLQPNRPKSTFHYFAPLRTRTLPTKEGPLLPAAHVAADRREREKRRERDEYTLGPTRSSPRTSLPSMSVQRRMKQSPRKQQQSPSTARRASAANLARAPIPLERIPNAPVHVGRGGKLVFGNSSSSSSDESSSSSSDEVMRRKQKQTARTTSGGRAPRVVFGSGKAARKTKPRSAIKTVDVNRLTKATNKLSMNRANDDDGENRARPRPGDKLARKLQATPVPASEDEGVIVLSDSDDIEELQRALDALTLSEARMKQHKRLPFLLKNLRTGFLYHCQKNGVRIAPPNAPRGAVKVVFKYYVEAKDAGASTDSSSDGREYQTYIGSMADWRCPMCELHKPFDTREMLMFHLGRDHAEVKVSWREITVRHEHRWRLDLVIPDVHTLEESSSDEDEEQEMQPQGVVPDQTEDRREEVRPRPNEPLFLRDSEESLLPGTAPSTTTLLSGEEVEEQKVLLSSASPAPIKWRLSSTPGGRRSLPTAVRTSYRGSLPARYPSPPPPHDKLGPAAQYPYLPEKDEDGQELYSCRIGGPRLFDLVSMLPTDEFGVTAWAIVDREEELFEMEDLRDEEKVIMALWNRWIELNRSSFISGDYFEGVKSFIDKYWRVIHQAAGWRALRAFLITLSVNHFLTFDKVLKSLQYYEELIGMSLWHKDDTNNAEGVS